MDAIVTAGGIPLPEDPLYPATRGETKALLDINGKPMVQWVLDALSEAATVDSVVLVGLTERSGMHCTKPVFYVSNQGKMVENIHAGAAMIRQVHKNAEYALIVASDVPAITGEMIDWVVNTAMETREDVTYNIIPREVMEKRFPGSKRTYTKLKDMEICGGDVNVARLKLIESGETDLWDKITDARKSPLRQAALIGFGTAARLMAGQLTLEKAEERIMHKLGITGRAVVCPYAEIGMDVDKLHQLEMMRMDLKTRVVKSEVKKTTRRTATVAKGPARRSGSSAKKGSSTARRSAPAAKKGSSTVRRSGPAAKKGSSIVRRSAPAAKKGSSTARRSVPAVKAAPRKVSTRRTSKK